MKSTRVDCGYYHDDDLTYLANQLFGAPGTQAGRRWFYRMTIPAAEWRRKGRNAKLKLVLYFRNSSDATFFCLKKSQK
jgi:hypothetical protein